MPQFIDSTGKGWTVRITYDGIRAVRDECEGLDLLDVVRPGSVLLEDLAYDDLKMIGALWALVKGQACDVTRQSFCEAMTPVHVESGFAALAESLADFFGESTRAQTLRLRLQNLQTGREADEKLRTELERVLSEFDPATKAANLANDHEAEILAAMLESSTVSSGSSQDD